MALIVEYERQPCLYDTKHKFNTNKHARNDAFLKIAGELKEINPTVAVEDIKKKITNLRQQFSHENAKIQSSLRTGTGTEDVYEPSVWWYEKLLFLVPHVKTRKTKSTLDYLSQDTSPETEIQDESEDTVYSEHVETPHTTSKKRKLKENVPADPIIEKTVATLQVLGNKLGEDSAKSSTAKTDIQVYAEYVARELAFIGDEMLLNDAKHSINNVLYEAKKNWLKMKKENEQSQDAFLLDGVL
ncbi:unnamed protein product [Tenebrio molitor]|jgi:hypothetical protein|nr:unnamed protein product [Tenebrio molitor]